MFTAGRILSKRTGRAASAFGEQETITADDLERRKFRCYVPFVWQSVLAMMAGFVVMATGACLCFVGFFAGHQQLQSGIPKGSNNTEVELVVGYRWVTKTQLAKAISGQC